MHPAIAQLASDRTSGATALVLRAIAILQSVAPDRAVLEIAARDLCRAQPSMGGMHTAAALALSATNTEAALATLAARIERSAAAIARIAAPLVALRQHQKTLRVATCSASAAVEATLMAIARREALRVACSESRPAREGVGLAARLGHADIPTTLYTDAGLSSALAECDALIVGADALGGSGFINKVGTGALAALAAVAGVPVFVLAGREKILPETVFPKLPIREGDPLEVDAPAGPYTVRNPYFERSPWGPVAQVITDTAEIPPVEILKACSWNELMGESYLSVIR